MANSESAESHLGDGDHGLQTTPAGSSSHHTPPQFVDAQMKITRGHSCILCQNRKVRCDKAKPCSNCVKAGVECRVVAPQPPRRRKRRIPERDLVERLRKYESLLSQNGIEFDGLGPDVKITDAGTVQEGDELDGEFVQMTDPPAGQCEGNVISSPGEKPHVPRTFKWFPAHKEFRISEEIFRDSSDDDDVGISINHAYDKMFGNVDGFPFLVGGVNKNVTSLHPTPIQIFQLWQIYLNNVNPLLKLSHNPTLQVRIIEASANINKISKSLEALMFAIYFIAITSMADEEVQEIFSLSRSVLLQRYYLATQQALLNAGFMRTPDLVLLQAYLLYLMGVRPYSDPRSLFCLCGIGVRLAHRMGLHRDGAQFHLSPFEIEERRRLWWSLAGFDRRIGEMTGSTITAISNGGDCKLPLNINDADLHLDAKDPPNAHLGATEMIFALTRLEFSKAPGSDKMKSVLSDVNPQPVQNLADHRLASYLERFSAYLEDTYLKNCDMKIPLHYFTIMMTRATICKLKVLAGFFRLSISNPTPLSEADSDALFLDSIKMIEYDSEIQSDERLKGFLWYTQMHFPFPAYVFLIKELRKRTTGELCERAWSAIFQHHESRRMTHAAQSPMHLAFSPLFVKAWESREAAEAQLGRTIAAPPLITMMRQLVARLGPRPKAQSPDSSRESPIAPMSTTGMNGTFVDAKPPPPRMTNMEFAPSVWATSPVMDANRQYAGAFAEMNFGGEMDWQYLMSEYGGFMAQPDLATMPTTDTNNMQQAFWR